MDGDQLSIILQGLEDNNLLCNIHHLLTGYIGSKSFLHSVLKVLHILKKYNSNVRYVCDPGKYYVSFVDSYFDDDDILIITSKSFIYIMV